MNPSILLAWLCFFGAASLPAAAQEAVPPQASDPAKTIFMLSGAPAPERKAFLDHAPAIVALGYQFDPFEPTEGTIISIKTRKSLTTSEAADLLRQVTSQKDPAPSKPALAVSPNAVSVLGTAQDAVANQGKAYENAAGGGSAALPVAAAASRSKVADPVERMRDELTAGMLANIERTDSGQDLLRHVKTVPVLILGDDGPGSGDGGGYVAASPTNPAPYIDMNIRPAVSAVLAVAAPEDRPMLQAMALAKRVNMEKLSRYLLSHPQSMQAACDALDTTMFHETTHERQHENYPAQPDFGQRLPIDPEIEAWRGELTYFLEKLSFNPKLSAADLEGREVKQTLILMGDKYDVFKDGIRQMYGSKFFPDLSTLRETLSASPEKQAQVDDVKASYDGSETRFLSQLPGIRARGYTAMREALNSSNAPAYDKLAAAAKIPGAFIETKPLAEQTEQFLLSRSGAPDQRMTAWEAYLGYLRARDRLVPTVSAELFAVREDDCKTAVLGFLAKARASTQKGARDFYLDRAEGYMDNVPAASKGSLTRQIQTLRQER